MRAAATAVLCAVALALTSCSADDVATPPAPAAASTSENDSVSTPPADPVNPADPVAPIGDETLVPAVMLGSVIRTPGRQVKVDLGGHAPATFVQTQAGFVVQDTTGTTYAVEDGATRPIGQADAGGGLALLVDTTGRQVAWVSPTAGGAVAQVYDARTRARTADVTLPDGARQVVLDDTALLYRSSPTTVTRVPVEGPTSVVTVERGLRLVAATAGRLELVGGGRTVLVPLDAGPTRVLRPAATLSPTGTWAVSSRGRVRVREVATGAEVTPDVSRAASRPLWVGADTFTVITRSAPLISPPDSEVFHVDRCDVTTGTCEDVVAVVTGVALSAVGLPVGATYPRR